MVEACGHGNQIFLLRKGGIVEAARRGFEVRHPEFLFFPTFEHQHVASLQPRFQHLATPQPEGVVKIDYVASVDDVRPAPPDRNLWEPLERFHVWQPSLIDMRYGYRPDLPLYVLLVRTFKLSKQITIPDRPSYAGCKSWVNLTEEISTEGAVPVLDDKTFEYRRLELLSALNASQ